MFEIACPYLRILGSQSFGIVYLYNDGIWIRIDLLVEFTRIWLVSDNTHLPHLFMTFNSCHLFTLLSHANRYTTQYLQLSPARCSHKVGIGTYALFSLEILSYCGR